MPDNIWKGKQTIVYKFRKPTKTFKIISDTSFTNRKILFTLEELLVKYKDGSIEDMSVDDKKFEKIAKGFSYIERYKDKDFTLENLTNAWDSRWYKDIALNGYKYNGNYYELQNPVFTPLYPLISNFFNTFIRNIDLSLLLVNNLFSTIAIFIFYITFLKFYNFAVVLIDRIVSNLISSTSFSNLNSRLFVACLKGFKFIIEDVSNPAKAISFDREIITKRYVKCLKIL